MTADQALIKTALSLLGDACKNEYPAAMERKIELAFWQINGIWRVAFEMHADYETMLDIQHIQTAGLAVGRQLRMDMNQ